MGLMTGAIPSTKCKSHRAEFWLVEKVSEIISGFFATLSAISCIFIYTECQRERNGRERQEERGRV